MTVTTKKFLINQLKLIMSLTDEQINLYTRETMFKVVEDLSGGICWASSHKIDDNGALLTPQAFVKWSEHPDKTLSHVIMMKVKGGHSLTKEHFGGVRSGSKFIFAYHYDKFVEDRSYDLITNFLADIDKLSKVIVSTREENEAFAHIRKRGPNDYKDIDIDHLIYVKNVSRKKFMSCDHEIVDSDLTPYFPQVLLG
jgi:hypothetical protein